MSSETETAAIPTGSGAVTGIARAAWLRLFILATGLSFGAASFRAFAYDPSYWKWVIYLGAGAVLGVAALDYRRAPPWESPARRRARRAAGLAAIGFAALALSLIPLPGHELSATLATVAMLVCAAAARWVPFSADEVRRLLGPDLAARPAALSHRVARTIFALLAGASALAAILSNDSAPVRGFAFWLLSLALFAVANLSLERAPRGGGRSEESGPAISASAELAAFLAIFATAALLRFLWLDRFPALIEGDEGRQALSAEAIWNGGLPNAFGIGWNGFPNLSYLVEWSGVLLFGKSNANFRLQAALIGTLSLLPLHLWVRRWWGGVVAVIATLLLAINREHLLWSRWAFNNIHVVLLAALVLATFARVLRTRRRIDWVWFGYALGLGFHTYHAAKLHPLLIAAAALFFAVGIGGFARRYAQGALVGALAFALCVGPLAVTMARNWQRLALETNRFDVGQLVDAWRQGDVAKTRAYLYAHAGGCLEVFSHYYKTREALFAPVVVVPFWLGIFWIFWRWRDPRHLVVLMWMGGILVIGGMITSYPPWKPRLVGLLPAACLVVALVAARTRALLWRAAGARGDVLFLPILTVWVGTALWHTLDTEFVYRPAQQRGEIMTSLGRAIEAMPLPGSAFLLGAEPRAVVRNATIADDPQRTLYGPVLDASSVPVAPSAWGSVLYLITAEQRSLVPLLRHYYPDAQARTVENQFDQTVLWSFALDPVHLASHRTLRRAAPRADGGGNWRGSFFAAESGVYAFRAGRDLSIDGVDLAARAKRFLAAGWHSVSIAADDDEPAAPPFEWILPGTARWSRIPAENLSDHAEAHGLLGRYFAGVHSANGPHPIEAIPDAQRVETALSFDWLSEWDNAPPRPIALPPATMEWVGTVVPCESSATALRLTTSAPAQLYLGDKLVADAAGAWPPQVVEADVALAGRTPLLLRVTRANGLPAPWVLTVEWRQPGGGWSAFARYSPAEPTVPR